MSHCLRSLEPTPADTRNNSVGIQRQGAKRPRRKVDTAKSQWWPGGLRSPSGDPQDRGYRLPKPQHLRSAISQHRRVLRSLLRVRPWRCVLRSIRKRCSSHAQSKRFATAGGSRTARSVWSAGVFTAAVLRHAVGIPREFLQLSRMGNVTANNPLALFIRWQISILDPRLGLRPRRPVSLR
jgi:hypothetical protein